MCCGDIIYHFRSHLCFQMCVLLKRILLLHWIIHLRRVSSWVIRCIHWVLELHFMPHRVLCCCHWILQLYPMWRRNVIVCGWSHLRFHMCVMPWRILLYFWSLQLHPMPRRVLRSSHWSFQLYSMSRWNVFNYCGICLHLLMCFLPWRVLFHLWSLQLHPLSWRILFYFGIL